MISLIKYFNRQDLVLSEDIDLPKEQLASVKGKISKLFTEKSNPDDLVIHKLAEKLQIDPHEFEEIIYSILSSFLSKGNFNKSGKKASDFDSNQIKMGIDVEKEHTDNPQLALRIALDHLAEIPDYYTRLQKMEADAKGD